ncbi:MAG TPA: ATP-binding protein [Rhodocyclaceae bacterium]|nr:ATP-binding protein [Rhodocyclaceae bacterium]
MDTRQWLLDASGEILLLIDAQSLQIRDANRYAVEQLGYPKAELIGQAVGEIECALSDLFYWDEVRLGRFDSEVEGAYRCADGSVLEVSKLTRRIDDAAACAGAGAFVVRATPIRQRRRVESELETLESRLRATLEATADGILLVDRGGSIINMNRRFSEMWRIPEKLLAISDDDGIFAHLKRQTARSPGGAPPSPRSDTDEETFDTLTLKDGRVFERASHPARENEQVIGRVFSYRDVTERHRNQQELIAARDNAKRASRAKSEFLAMISHEIRTPMNGVLGIAELLASTKLTTEQADYVRIIRSSGETLLTVINDVLDYSKIEAGKLTLEPTDFALVPLLEEVIQLFRFRRSKDGPELSCTADARVPDRLRGDSVRLRQILFNLVGNAFKFTEKGSIQITVSPATECDGKIRLHFSVRDTGIGIPPDRQASIFEAFEQADASTTRRFGGTGLGLSICRQLVKLMNGEIGLVSEPGKGSDFWFTAGFDVAQTSPMLTAAAAETASPLTPTTRILVVDDNPVNKQVLLGMLRRLGASTVVLASDGGEAVNRATLDAAFDFILMDTQMPVMDGLEATRRLRASGNRSRIIGVSAGAMEEERQAALASGMDDYLLKPVSMTALRTALHRK